MQCNVENACLNAECGNLALIANETKKFQAQFQVVKKCIISMATSTVRLRGEIPELYVNTKFRNLQEPIL